MNKVYKLVWNATLGSWVAVSERAKGKKKSTTNKVIKNSVLLLSILSSGEIFALDIAEDLNVTGSLTVTQDVISNGVSLTTVNSNLNQAQGQLSSLSNQVNDPNTGLASKASQSDLNQTQNDLNTLDDQVNNATTGLATKVSQSDFNNLNNQVNDPNSDLATKASTADLNSLKNQTWSLQTNNGQATAVKSTDTVNFVNGKNITVTNTGTNISIATSDNPEFNTVKIGDTTNNTTLSSTADGLDLDGDKLTNIADGNIAAGSSDAVTGGQINTYCFKVGKGLNILIQIPV